MKIRELLLERVTDLLSKAMEDAQKTGRPIHTDDLARDTIAFIMETAALVCEDAAHTPTADIMEPAYRDACRHLAKDLRSLITPTVDKLGVEFLNQMFKRRG
jgi:hypothetical protein